MSACVHARLCVLVLQLKFDYDNNKNSDRHYV